MAEQLILQERKIQVLFIYIHHNDHMTLYLYYTWAIFYKTGRDQYYDNQTPADWVDILFIIIIAIHHIEYSFKFTDYSLAHLTMNTQQYKSDECVDEDENKLANIQPEQLCTPATTEDVENAQNGQQEEQGVLEMMDVFHMFSTKSDGDTVTRPHTNLCCCISWSPRLFTWYAKYIQQHRKCASETPLIYTGSAPISFGYF